MLFLLDGQKEKGEKSVGKLIRWAKTTPNELVSQGIFRNNIKINLSIFNLII